ncbi:TetR family transcriptional regulator [Actinomadura sp. CNU-125]|uniref:TetR/AcrR family transcriptional regulator n=1 Tax=Actinomadura sp. CNU-125 TaxID=1904961 RepID=UPI0009620944|nr:TetR/AcrR family transcriptional regulator [Actinomadura sp. CNU-125]OLT10676.1 TetR family transcriptional regulator [Actinomadura sp. CNU-125]
MTTAEETAAEPGAPRPLRADARRNRELDLAAARETFAADGPDASLNEIARRAGVGPGTLYRNFPTRQALQAAVLADRVAHLCGRADELIATVPPAAALSGWLRAFLEHARSDHGLGGAVLSEPPGLDCHQTILDAAERVLARAREAGAARPDVSAADTVQLVVGVALATGHGPDSGQGERLLGLVLDALRPGGASGAGRG